MADVLSFDEGRRRRDQRDREQARLDRRECDACGVPYADWSAKPCSSVEGYHRHLTGSNLLAQGRALPAAIPAGAVFNVQTSFGPDGQMRFERGERLR